MEQHYIKANGIDYRGTLQKLEKSKEYLQPVFEAFTNSLESIKSLNDSALDKEISININYLDTLLDNGVSDILSIEIQDNGIGFNDDEFERFTNLNDNQKGYNNNGTGRIQFLHFFDKTIFESVYHDNNSKTGYFKRTFTISKNNAYLMYNAIISLQAKDEIEAVSTYTKLKFENFLDPKDKKYYDDLTIHELKETLIEHYLDYFCENKKILPQIAIKAFVGKTLKEELKIIGEDIPDFDKEEPIEVSYSRFSSDGTKIEKMNDKTESFILKSFLMPSEKIEENSIKLVSKHEIIKDKKIKLRILQPKDIIDEKRYLFLLSGSYIDRRDGDNRGSISLLSKDDFKKLIKSDKIGNLDLYEEVLIDDIEDATNEKIISMYSEISKKVDTHKQEIDKLKNMFLLNDKTLKSVKINLQDSEDTILKKVYEADSKIIAEMDMQIKKKIDKLATLDTSSKDEYSKELNKEVSELVKLIPLQNRMALTHYVARRKLVLDLFQKIIDSELDKQNEKRNIDEKLLHNLIFQQSSEKPDESDLWVINEEFIYFKGCSEKKLGSIQINGESIFKDESSLSAEEIAFKNSLGEDRYSKKPDILLFPDEGKCIILEFKNPKINISEQLQQINNYATLIWNFSKDKFQFSTFYGYFIGEKISALDVRAHDSSFIESYHFDYLFRPNKPIAGFFKQGDANLYMEVIKYSTLLKRAQKRNEIFISKLIDNNKC